MIDRFRADMVCDPLPVRSIELNTFDEIIFLLLSPASDFAWLAKLENLLLLSRLSELVLACQVAFDIVSYLRSRFGLNILCNSTPTFVVAVKLDRFVELGNLVSLPLITCRGQELNQTCRDRTWMQSGLPSQVICMDSCLLV